MPKPGLFKALVFAWFTPPAETPLYAALPDVAPDFYSGLAPVEIEVYDFLRQPKNGARILEGGDWYCDAPSYAKIAVGLKAKRSRSTIYRAIKNLLGVKKTLQARAVMQGGRRRRTIYYAPPWKDVLQARRESPGVVLTAANHLIVMGRRRMPIDAKTAEAWSIDVQRAPTTARRLESREQESQRIVPVAPPIPASEVRRAEVAEIPPPAQQVDEAAVLAKLLESCPANAADARDLLASARAAAPSIPIEAVLEQIGEIRMRKARLDQKRRDPNPVITPKWFLDRMPSHVEHWKAAERERLREAARRSAFERDERVNRIAQAIGGLERMRREDGRAAPEDVQEREYYELCLAEASPEDLAAAQALLADTKTRTA